MKFHEYIKTLRPTVSRWLRYNQPSLNDAISIFETEQETHERLEGLQEFVDAKRAYEAGHEQGLVDGEIATLRRFVPTQQSLRPKRWWQIWR